jgi:nicotinamidase-related amidase
MSADMEKFKLDADKAVLVVIDIQERLVPAMPPKVYTRLRGTVAMLVEAAKLLGVPVVTTEQYPKGIGHTVAELAESCSDKVVEKVSFGCCSEPNFIAAIKETGRSQVIVTGMEAHVCVYQTVLGLLEEGYHVHLVRDAICSRNKIDFLAGVANAAQAGAVATTAETVLFQMLKQSTHDQFKAISRLVKDRN